MKYCNVYGDSSTGKTIEMLEYLRKHVPQINWELCWSDVGVDEVWSCSYIGVPENQLKQASDFIGLLGESTDFSGYSSKEQFPELFGDDNSVLPSITSFAQNVKKFIDFLTCPPDEDTEKYLQELLINISTLYANYFKLPDIQDTSHYQSCVISVNINFPAKLIPFTKFCGVEDPFEDIINTKNIKIILQDIAGSLDAGYAHYYKYVKYWDCRQLWFAVVEWKNSFRGIDGWGTGIINAQKALHHALMYHKNRKHSELNSNIIPENYFFAHCVYEISGIEENETIITDWNMIRFLNDLADFARVNGELISLHYEEVFNINSGDIWDITIESFDISEEEMALIVESLPKREKDLVENKAFDEWPVEEFTNGVIWDSLWRLIDNRIIEAERRIRIGQGHTLGIILNWVDLFNCVMESALGSMFGKEAYIHIQLGNVSDFPLYFVNNLLERIEYHQTEGYKYPLIPFPEAILALRKTMDQPEWYKNEIHFGRFLEWINIFKTVVE